MPNGDKLLSAEEFAAKVKAKYPDYAGVPDQELTAKILQKYPEYSSAVMSPGVAEARKTLPKPEAESYTEGMTSGPQMSPTGISFDPTGRHISTRTQAEVLGSMVGGEAVGGIKGLANLPKIVRGLATAGGAGVGGGAGTLATGGSPKEAAKTAGEFAAAGIALETGMGAIKAGARLVKQLRINPEDAAAVAKATTEAAMRGEVPARAAHLANINAAEEATRSAISTSEGSIERQLSAKYDALGIQVPVEFTPIGATAQAGEADIIGRGLGTVPRPVGAAAEQMRGKQRVALRIFQQVAPILDEDLQVAGPFNMGRAQKAVDALKKLRELKGLDFNEAQALKSAVGKALSRSGKYAKDQADALASLRDTIISGMEKAARQQTQLNLAFKEMGVMPEGTLDDFYRFRDSLTGGSFSVPKSRFSVDTVFEEATKLRRSLSSSAESLSSTAQMKQTEVRKRFSEWNPDAYTGWQNAEHDWRQFHADFRNPGAPLKRITSLRPNSTGKTIGAVASNPGATMDAMRRWNLLHNDFLNVLDNPNLETDVKDAKLMARSAQAYAGKTQAEIEEAGEAASEKARKTATKERSSARKKALGLAIGAGSVEEYLRRRGILPLAGRYLDH